MANLIIREACIKKLIIARQECGFSPADIVDVLYRIKGKKVSPASISMMENKYTISVDTLLELVDYYHREHGYTYESFINPTFDRPVKVDQFIESNNKLIEILQRANDHMLKTLH